MISQKEGLLMNIRELIQILPDIISITGNVDIFVDSIACDSNEVKKGALFVAIPGTNSDGHDFISEALKCGAKAVVGEKELDLGDIPYIRVKDSRKALAWSSAWLYDYPGTKLKLIGVTGTSGKTTITYLIRVMLKEIGISGVIGTIGYLINDRMLPASYYSRVFKIKPTICANVRRKCRICGNGSVISFLKATSSGRPTI